MEPRAFELQESERLYVRYSPVQILTSSSSFCKGIRTPILRADAGAAAHPDGLGILFEAK